MDSILDDIAKPKAADGVNASGPVEGTRKRTLEEVTGDNQHFVVVSDDDDEPELPDDWFANDVRGGNGGKAASSGPMDGEI